MDLHAVSPDTCVTMDAKSPKWGNGNLLCGRNRSTKSSRQNPLDAAESELGERATSFPTSPSLFEVVWGNRSDPDIAAPK